MNRRADGKPGWTLEFTAPDKASREDFDFVAICTGQFNDPQELKLSGEDAFRAQGGQILHSSSYGDAPLAKGRQVVVLGGSKSATDIAVNAVNSGAREVTLSIAGRSGVSPTSSAVSSTSSASSTSAPRKRCSAAGASEPLSRLRTRSRNRWSGRVGAGWRAS